MKLIVALLAVLMSARPAPALSPKGEVAHFLSDRAQWESGKSQKQVRSADLRHLGPQAIPLLAAHLRDESRADVQNAADAMLELDPDAAALFLLSSLPQSGSGVADVVFPCLTERVEKGDGKIHLSMMHDAAVRCLKTRVGDEVNVIKALGVTGGRRDIPLLEPYYRLPASTNSAPVTREARLRNAAEGSLARLGDAEAMGGIMRELAAPVPAKYGDDLAGSLGAAIGNAAFSHDRRFVPLLLRHLDDQNPTRPPQADYGVAIPAQCAAAALDRLTRRKPSPDIKGDVAYWKQWRQAHPPKSRLLW